MDSMNRKQFLALAALAGMAAPGCLEAKGSSRKVIVVGAGMAGLVAATRLKQAGMEVEILEAGNRVGGRMWTDTSLGMALDLGAAWVHGAGEKNPLTSLVKKLSIPVLETDADSLALYSDGEEISDELYEEIDENTEDLYSSGRNLKRRARLNDTMEEVLEEMPDDLSKTVRQGVRWNFASDVEIELSADARELSLKYWDEDYAFDGPEWLLKTGFVAVARHLAQGLMIRTNTTVSRIGKTANQVEVHTNAGQLQADFVVVTCSVGVLQSGAIRFEPGLSQERQEALSRIKMGTMKKIALSFPRAFWPSVHRMGDLRDGPTLEFWNLQPLTGKPALVALTQGAFARELERGHEKGAKEVAMEHLRSMFGKVPDPIGMIRTKWHSDPLFRGSYSIVASGSSIGDFETMAEQDDDRVFLAGEACNARYPGTLHGAYLSGVSVAKSILELV